ncbi:MAG: hypothetical protein K9M44_00390 [Candidatus Pacebacteria bacterium]|nr:hypothetical protein [Candidatus Paceibacterota bacterium]
MKNSIFNKIINLCLWESSDKLFLELNPNGLSVDYNQDQSQDLYLSELSRDKLEKEILNLNHGYSLNSGESLTFIETTSFGPKEITLTRLAGESKKYSLAIKKPLKTNYRLSELGLHHFLLKKLKNHLINKAPKGLIIVAGEKATDRDKTIVALANLFKDKPYSLLNLNSQLPLQDVLSLDLSWGQSLGLSAPEISSLIRKHQPDVVISNLDKKELKTALLDLAQEDRLIIAGINSPSLQQALSSLAEICPTSYLQENINLAIYQKFLPRLCPFCQAKQSLNKYEKNLLDDLQYRYNWKELDKKSRQALGCKECLYSGSPGEIGLFEFLSFRDRNLSTANLIDDARKKYELGLIDTTSLLSLN